MFPHVLIAVVDHPQEGPMVWSSGLLSDEDFKMQLGFLAEDPTTRRLYHMDISDDTLEIIKGEPEKEA